MEDESLNGMTFNDVLLPAELIVNMLKYVDVNHLLKCRLVCKNWNEIITSHGLWFAIYKEKYRKHPKLYPWALYYCLFTGYLDKNLLKNCNGEEKLKYWTVIHNGGDKILIEKSPAGSDPLPSNVEEFNNQTSCFVTSYGECCKHQRVYVTNRMLKDILNKYKPHIYASEWVAARFDCGARYKLRVTVVGKKTIVEKEVSHKVEQWCGRTWTKVELLVDDYPDDVQYIDFFHTGQDTQYWAGHYGMKMAGGMLKILFDTAKVEQCPQ